MAPSKASKSAASGRPTLRQSSLSFTSKRTTAAGSDAKGKTSRKSSTVPSTPRPVSPPTPADESSEDDDDTEEFELAVAATEDVDERPVKRRKLVRKDAVAAESESLQPKPRRFGTGVFRSREGVENADGGKTHREDEERPRLNVNDKRWRKQYGEARDQMGNLEPIHGKHLTNVHHILRVFDLSYEYGPCIGVTRLARWERADALGLNPPPEVKEILMTKEGTEKPEFAECVFHGEV